MKPSRVRRPLQIATFLRKEAVDVIHQPRLLLTLVIGPFLIMAVFGIGYRDSPEPLRTLFVAPAGSPLLGQVEAYAEDIGSYVDFAGISNDLADAERQLLEGDIDLLVSFPDDPLQTVLDGDQARITIVHTRLDPIERTAISFASRLAIDQINGQILATIVEGGQGLARPASQVFGAVDAAVSALDSAITGQDEAAAQTAIDDLQELTAQVALSIRTTTLLSERLVADSTADAAEQGVIDAATLLRETVSELRANATVEESAAQLTRVRELLNTIGENYDSFTSVDPAVLVQPFTSRVRLAVDDVDNVTDWYAPAAVVLMLQQFGVAFGALSFVRERQLGIVDVFRVAPVNATETLLGKYLAYLVIGGAIGAVLTTLVVTTLGVPIAAGIGDVAIVMGLSLFASIGLGFVISLGSASDAQAVQYTMILLLASLFFSGFFLSVGQMEGVALYASWLLPVTYGMELLRDVMLRGDDLDRNLVASLAAYGVVMFVFALLGTRRRLAVVR